MVITTKDLFFYWAQQLNVLLKNELETELKIADETIEELVLKNAPAIFQNAKISTENMHQNWHFEKFDGNLQYNT